MWGNRETVVRASRGVAPAPPSLPPPPPVGVLELAVADKDDVYGRARAHPFFETFVVAKPRRKIEHRDDGID
jgi:hypothetical protein